MHSPLSRALHLLRREASLARLARRSPFTFSIDRDFRTVIERCAAVPRPDQPGIDEPIRNPVVHVSGDLASVWAEYQVRRDGTVTHCGFDAFHLARRDGRWKLLNISDTYQTTGCGPAWPR